MKKLLLLCIVFISIQSNAQFSSQGYGWKFQSTVNYNDVDNQRNYGRVEFYYNVYNDNLFKIVYANGQVERYKPYSQYPFREGYTKSGYKYKVYQLICLETSKIVTLQTFNDLEIIRLLYNNVMVEFGY
jgi:hypothetical protein